jgi:hypothetical protein
LPAPSELYDVPLWCNVTVDDSQHVAVAGGMYMLPLNCVHRRLLIRADKSLVRFYKQGVLVKVLPRAPVGGRSFDAADIPEHKRAYALRDEQFLAAQAREHGAAIGDFADRLLEGPAPWTRMRRVSALLSLVRHFGATRVEAECRRAIDVDMTDVDRLKRMLAQPMSPIDDKPTARIIPIARYLRPMSDYALKQIPDKEGE